MIHRVIHNRENPYFQLNRASLNDQRLSLKAKGLLAYLLSKPDNWEVRESNLINSCADGRDAIRSGMKELVAAGYIVRHQIRNADGSFSHMEAHIFETPQESTGDECDDKENTEKLGVLPTDGKSVIGKSGDGKHTPIENTEVLERIEENKESRARFLKSPEKQKPSHSGTSTTRRSFRQGLPIDGPPVQTERTYAEKAAGELYEAVAHSGNLDHRSSVISWSNTIRQFIIDSEIDSKEFDCTLKWYIEHLGQPFIPVAFCARSFCDRYYRIRAARRRWEEENPGEAYDASLEEGESMCIITPPRENMTEEERRAERIA